MLKLIGYTFIRGGNSVKIVLPSEKGSTVNRNYFLPLRVDPFSEGDWLESKQEVVKTVSLVEILEKLPSVALSLSIKFLPFKRVIKSDVICKP